MPTLTSPRAGLDPQDDVRKQLADRARQELDALRSAFVVRLAALEAALASPGDGAELEGLILDLARAATEEAESAAKRAILHVQLELQGQVASARAEAESGRAALAGEQTARTALETELTAARGALQREQQALAAARAASEREQKAAAATRADLTRAQSDLEMIQTRASGAERARDDLARRLRDLETKLAEREQQLAQVASARDGLERRLAESGAAHEEGLGEARAALEQERARTKALERAKSDLERAKSDLERTKSDLERANGDLAQRQRELEASAVHTEGAHEKALRDAGAAADKERARADKLQRDREDLARRLHELELRAAELQAHAADLETRAAEQEARAAKAAGDRESLQQELAVAGEERHALAEAHAALERERARANSFECERDTLAAEVASLRQDAKATVASRQEIDDRLQASAERIRALEHELRRRDLAAAEQPPAEPHDAPGGKAHHRKKVEAPAPAKPAAAHARKTPDATPAPEITVAADSVFPGPARRVSRYASLKGVTAQVDGDDAMLVDVSIAGAQVIAPKALKPNQTVRLRLSSDKHVVACKGKIVWARLEPSSSSRPFHYRAGMHFTSADEPSMAAFLAHVAPEPAA